MGELNSPVANPQLGRTGAGFFLGTLCAAGHVGGLRERA